MWEFKNIPKIVHFYWGCNKVFSYLRYLTIKSFRKFNPDWEIFLHLPTYPCTKDPTWNSGEQTGISPSIDYLNKVQDLDVSIIYHDFKKYGFFNDAHEVHKADFIRWQLLSDLGGVWSDVDIIYVAPMGDMLDNTPENSDATIAFCTYPGGAHTLGFLMSSTGNPLFAKIATIALKVFNPERYQGIGTDILNRFLSRVLLDKFNNFNMDIIFLDYRSVYSINYENNGISKFFNINYTHKKTKGEIGYHWYGGSPMSQQYEAMVIEENYLDFKNALSGFIAESYSNQAERQI